MSSNFFDSSGSNPPISISSPNTQHNENNGENYSPFFGSTTNNNNSPIVVRQNAFNYFRLSGGFSLTYHWLHILFHFTLIAVSIVVLAITWTQKLSIAPALRIFIAFMSLTSVGRIFKAIYERRWPLIVLSDFGTVVFRPVNTFAGNLAMFLHHNIDLICVGASVIIMIVLDKHLSEDAEKNIPLLFWTTMVWSMMYFLYFVVPIFFILGLIACLPCIIFILQRFFNFSLINPNNENQRTAPATQEILDKIWRVKYTADESFKYINPENSEQIVVIEKESTKCSICLGWYEDNDDLRVLPCSHHFHQSCADEWFKITATCPLCVRPIRPTPENIASNTNPDSNV